MKAILMSIQPKWLAKILNGDKTIEIRKIMPKCKSPIDVYIYCTKDKKYANLINRGGFLTGMVVAKFTLNYVSTCLNTDYGNEEILKNACLTKQELDDYVGKRKFFAWHIENLVIFDKPKELGDFSVDHSAKWRMPIKAPIIKAPQSWQYVEVEQ